MDSHDSPRSIVPARSYSAPMPAGSASWSPTPAIPQAAPSPQLFKAALRGMRRYWWLIVGLWPVISIAACAVIYTKIHPLYESQSYIRVEDPMSLFKEGNQADLNVFLETLVQLIQSNNVLSAAANDQEVQNLPRIRGSADPVIELRKAVLVNKVPGTFLISVSMMSEDSREAATVVNAVVDAFIKQNRLWADNLSTGQKKDLVDYLNKYKEQSKELENRWLELVRKGDASTEFYTKATTPGGDEKNGGKKVESSTALVTIEEFKNVQAKKRETQMELAAAEMSHNDLLNRKPQADLSEAEQGEIDAQVRMIFQREPETVALREKLYEVQDKIKKVRAVGRNSVDPAETKHQATFAQIRERYEELWHEREPQIRAQLLTHQTVDPQKEIRESALRVANLKTRMKVLEDQSKGLKMASTAMATDTVQIEMIREERDSINQMRETIQRKLDDLEFTSKDGTRIRLVGAGAVPAGKPRSDNRMKYLAATPVGVLFVVLGLVLALELRSGRVSDPESLSIRMRHEVFPIAPLPNIRAGEDARTPRAEQKLARFVQSLDHLRVALCEGNHIGHGRCVLITSATGGEGKTTLSAHLAARCANAGTSILLIDADMRRASLGRLLDVVSGPGLADVLNGDISLADALQPIQAGGFAFLSAGTTDIDPSRILTSSRVSALIEQLRASYDLILIDSPPILPVPDALLLGRYVDGVVMASRFDASRLPLVEKASRQLAAAGIPILGMVVNGARGHSSNYDNYHYNYPNPANRASDEPTPA